VSVFEGTPRFEIVRRLGVGGMGTVFEAFDRERQIPVALKVLNVENPEALVRFKREFRALQSVHHPNLISLGELFAKDHLWFFTMELVHGVDLLAHIRAETASTNERTTLPRRLETTPDGPRRVAPFDLARLRAGFHQLALGLAALHRQGHIHRDVKPSNVMVAPDNRVVLLDFGLVREAAGGTTDSSPDLVVGTPEYMAPEQAMGSELGAATDWYAVGALLYEALTGEPPFSGTPMSVMVQKQMADPPPPSSVAADVPDDLDALCMALLRRDPRTRPQEAEILRRLYVELRRDDRTYLTLPLQPIAERFIGRHEVLETLGAALDEVVAGRQRLCFVTGAWGIGKTALVRELARRFSTDSRAPLVWSSRCHERESIPFKAVDMLVDDASRFLARAPRALADALLPDDVGLLAGIFPVLERVAGIAERGAPGPELTPEARRAALFAATRELFRRIARVQPLVLIIEDLQWADADGLALLRALLLPPSDAPILFVGTMRTDQPFVFAPSELVDGMDSAQMTPLHLEPLTPAETIDLVDALVPDADEQTVRRVVQQAGGHPLFARELCLVRDAQVVRLGDALRARIEPLPAPARAVLEVLAVSEGALPQSMVGTIAALPWPETERAITHLRAAQLVRTVGLRRGDLVEIAHDQVRVAMRATLLPPALRTLHERIATAMAEAPRASVEPLAAHWLGAGQRRRALEVLLAGAAQSAVALAFERASALYQRALGLCEPDERDAIERDAAAVRQHRG
jgi:eukaryotic-like serine/threonine-protein kinase